MFDDMRACMAKDGTTDEEDYKTTGYTLRCNCTLPSMLWLKKNQPNIYNQTIKFLSAHAVLAMAFTGKYVDDLSGITFSKIADVKTLTYIP